jgi:branched-chain amino acid transport system substrate-binding protein
MAPAADAPITVGLITDLTGPLSFLGVANANVAGMVVEDLNAAGGLLGRRVELIVEDSATDEGVAARKGAAMADRQPDVLLGGIYSSTRQAIKGPAVDDGGLLYIYPEQYEGRESHPLIFCTGPVPAQQVDPLIPWLMEHRGASRFYLPSADYVWPHVLNARVREVVTANGGTIVGEENLPMDHMTFDDVVGRIMDSGADCVFNTVVPPGVTPLLDGLHAAGFRGRGGTLVCTYMDENFLNMVPAEQIEGLVSCLDWYQEVPDPFGAALLADYRRRHPGAAQFTAGSACTGLYRGLRLWQAAVEEAGTTGRDEVVAALDHASIAESPGGPAEMVPGQHHVRMNMFIAEAGGGRFRVVESLGAIDPDEALVGAA